MAATRRNQPLGYVKNKLGLSCLRKHILPSMLAHPSARHFVGEINRRQLFLEPYLSRNLNLTKINKRLACRYYINEEDCWDEINVFFKVIIETHDHSGPVFKHGMDLHKHLLSLIKNVQFKNLRVNPPRAVKKKPALLPIPQYFRMTPRYVGSYSPRMRGCVDIIEDLNFNMTLSFAKYFWQTLKNFPEYYRVVKQPINLEIIGEKLTYKMYVDSDEFCSDVLLMIRNSFEFYHKFGEMKMATMMLLQYFEYRYEMLPLE